MELRAEFIRRKEICIYILIQIENYLLVVESCANQKNWLWLSESRKFALGDNHRVHISAAHMGVVFFSLN